MSLGYGLRAERAQGRRLARQIARLFEQAMLKRRPTSADEFAHGHLALPVLLATPLAQPLEASTRLTSVRP